MIVLTERIQVARPAHEVFTYAGEFAHCEQWDSTASRSLKLSRGRTGKGTEYSVVCRLPLGSLTLRYRVLHWEPPNRVVLQARLFD